jgi:hypothetical protein
MQHYRDLIVTDAAALVVLLVVLLIGWREAAAFGLGALVVLNLMALLRERIGRKDD